MTDSALRALVVDDEPIARRTIMWALSNENFECMPATDGIDALQKLNGVEYDLIVTDLCMPNKHGYAFITEVLGEQRATLPVVVAHSSVDEPRLTKDLMLRGVDDVVYKPTNYAAFAAKMRGLVLNRRSKVQDQPLVASDSGLELANSEQVHEGAADSGTSAITMKEFDTRLADVTHILPVSNTFAHVLELLGTSDFDVRSLASVVGTDAVLSIELLRAANSGQYTRTGRKITDLNDAITKLGAKRIAEVSIAVGTLDGFAKLVLPWFDRDIARRRSLAGGATAERLLKLHNSGASENGVVFSAMIYPLTRSVVGTVYPRIYETLIDEAKSREVSLQILEREMFPRTPAEATLQLLQNWRLPIEVCRPLSHADSAFESLAILNEPTRTWVKLLKTAIILGEHAVGEWADWEKQPELPPHSVLTALKIGNVPELIEEIRNEVKRSPNW